MHAILRHEAGHPCSTPTSCNAARAGNNCRPVFENYPLYYGPIGSRRYVQHLGVVRADHPDEISPKPLRCGCGPVEWRTRYAAGRR